MEENNSPKSILQIVFADVSSTLFTVNMQGVTPLQLLATAEYLRFIGQAGLAQQQMQMQEKQERTKIIVPKTPDFSLDE